MGWEELSAKDKIISAKVISQSEQPFWYFILMYMKLRPWSAEDEAQLIKTGISPTMGVDNKGILYYSESFVNSLSRQNLFTVLMHEASHVVFEHVRRGGNRQPTLWNIAVDVSVNCILARAGFYLPKELQVIWPHNTEGDVKISLSGGVTIELMNCHSKTAEQIYDEILTQVPPNNNPQYGGGDAHADWDKGDKSTGEGKEKDEQKWKSVLSEAVAFGKMRGILPKGMDKELDALLEKNFDWKTLLRKYITAELPHDYSYRRPSRKSMATGIYMPSYEKEFIRLIVAVDVSGSISDKDFSEFMGEVISITQGHTNVKVDLLQWDTEVMSHKEVLTDNAEAELSRTNRQGCGGTTATCVGKYIEEKELRPKLVVYLTDGYIEQSPDVPDCDRLWVITKDGTTDIPEEMGEEVLKIDG